MEKKVQLVLDGQELTPTDVNDLGVNSALADDRVLAELLRLAPYNGGAYAKAIAPFAHSGTTNPATVQPGTGGVVVSPFRAVVGTRVASSSSGIDNWRDIRSVVFVGGAASLTLAVPLDAETTGVGQGRWDLIYAEVTVDADTTTEARYKKDPTSKLVSAANIVTRVQTTIAIKVVKGTAAAYSFAGFPLLPSDSSTVINIPLAYVGLANGFGPATVLAPNSIHDVAPLPACGTAFGLSSAGPPDGSFSVTGTVQTRAFASTPAGRSQLYLPASMVGTQSLFIPVDMQTGSAGGWSHQSGDVIDSSDWRNRIFKWIAMVVPASETRSFAWAATGTVGTVPQTFSPPASASFQKMFSGFGQSFVIDDKSYVGSYFAGMPGAAVFGLMSDDFPVHTSIMATGSGAGIYCDLADGGKLKWFNNGTAPTAQFFIWLDASGPYPNH